MKNKQTTNIPFYAIRSATAYDSSVYLNDAFKDKLALKYVHPQPYSRKKLYANMAGNKTAVYTDYPMKMTKKYGEQNIEALIRNMEEGLPKKEKINIRTGPSRTVKRVTIKEAIEKWKRQKAKFGVTDLHFRKTDFFKTVDANAISYFNLLTHCPYEVAFLEMMTLVISARGIFSDSHSDDGDGSNHCFTGKKLWLAWDRKEGQQNGLEDCTYDAVYDKAKFSMKKFVLLKSAHWFVVSDNCTLFMPGNFTHKVITLEPYIGFGSFYVTIPGYINTLKRWLLAATSDVKGDFIDTMNTYSLKKLKQIAVLSKDEKERWGFDYIKKTIASWKKGLSKKQVDLLLNEKNFTDFLAVAKMV